MRFKTLSTLKRSKTEKMMDNRYEKIRKLGSDCVRAAAAKQPIISIPERISVEAQLKKAQQQEVTK